MDSLENLAFGTEMVPALLVDAESPTPFQGGLERYLDSLAIQGLAVKTRVQSLRVRFSQEQHQLAVTGKLSLPKQHNIL